MLPRLIPVHSNSQKHVHQTKRPHQDPQESQPILGKSSQKIERTSPGIFFRPLPVQKLLVNVY